MSDNHPTRCDLMLFGALGDLAQRKLFPALYQLERANLLAPGSRILAVARPAQEPDAVRRQLQESLRRHVGPAEFDAAVVDAFLARVAYQSLDFRDAEGYASLREWRGDESHPLIVYMATPPSMYGVIGRHLKQGRLLRSAHPGGGGETHRARPGIVPGDQRRARRGV